MEWTAGLVGMKHPINNSELNGMREINSMPGAGIEPAAKRVWSQGWTTRLGRPREDGSRRKTESSKSYDGCL